MNADTETMKRFLVGINPETGVVDTVAKNTPEHAEDMRRTGLIIVPASKEAARHGWNSRVQCIYEVANG